MVDRNPGLILTGALTVGVLAGLLAETLAKKHKKNNTDIEEQNVDEIEDKRQTDFDIKYKVSSRRKTEYTNNENQLTQMPRLKLQKIDQKNYLIQELKFLDSPLCEIEKVHNLIIDRGLTEIETIISPKASELTKQAFIYKNSFILYKVEYGPTCFIQSAKRWLRAGPRYNLYFKSTEVKALIVTCGSIVPGLNVIIRELVHNLIDIYEVTEIYGAKFGFSGIIDEDFVELNKNNVKNIHYNGGSILGVSRGGFNLQGIITSLHKNKFNQVYIIGGDGSIKCAHLIQQQLLKKKSNIAVCIIPKSVQGNIPIAEEQMGFQTTVEETAKAVEVAFVESQSHEYGIGLVRVFGRNSGFVASHVAEATGCANVVLVPEFQWDLYGDKGVLEYIKEQLAQKKRIIIIISEGAVYSLRDVEIGNQGFDKSGNALFINVGEFLKDEIVKFMKQNNQPITIKYIDPLYITRACKANAYDTKLCSQMAMNAVNGCMAGFTGFAAVIVHSKTCLVPLSEMISGQYENKLIPENRHWQRVLAQTGQPSFLNDDDLQ